MFAWAPSQCDYVTYQIPTLLIGLREKVGRFFLSVHTHTRYVKCTHPINSVPYVNNVNNVNNLLRNVI